MCNVWRYAIACTLACLGTAFIVNQLVRLFIYYRGL